MKRLNYVTAVIVCACVAITAVTRIAADNVGTQDNEAAPTDLIIETKADVEYILTEYNGLLAVYKLGEDKPFKITDAKLNELPELDSEKIKNGITVKGETALKKALEDYCS